MFFSFYFYRAGKLKNQFLYSISFVYAFILIFLLFLPNQITFFPGTNMLPRWNLPLTIYMIVIFSSITIIPFIIFSLQLWKRFKKSEARKRWLMFMLGGMGMISIYYIEFYNLSPGSKPEILKSFFSIYILIATIVWGYFLYQGLGRKI
jgi:membrane protease YdiL (CAAX protease family)